MHSRGLAHTKHNNMTAVSPPDAELSTIGQWGWLIPLKEEEVSLTPQKLITLLQGPLLIH